MESLESPGPRGNISDGGGVGALLVSGGKDLHYHYCYSHLHYNYSECRNIPISETVVLEMENVPPGARSLKMFPRGPGGRFHRAPGETKPATTQTPGGGGQQRRCRQSASSGPRGNIKMFPRRAPGPRRNIAFGRFPGPTGKHSPSGTRANISAKLENHRAGGETFPTGEHFFGRSRRAPGETFPAGKRPRKNVVPGAR